MSEGKKVRNDKRLGVIVYDAGLSSHLYGVGIIEEEYPTHEDVKRCVRQIIHNVFVGVDIEILNITPSHDVELRVFTKDRVSYYDTSFKYKHSGVVVDYDRG